MCACKHSNLCQGKRSLNVQYHWMKDIFQNRWLKWKRICTGVILYLAFKVVFAELQLELYTSIINLSLILNSCRLRKSCSIICLSILFAYTCETCTLNDLFHWTFKYLSFQQQKTKLSRQEYEVLVKLGYMQEYERLGMVVEECTYLIWNQ